MEDSQRLWAQTSTNKYVKGELGIKKLGRKQVVSNAWRGITSTVNLLNKGMKMMAYNGREILFSGRYLGR